MKSRGGPVTRWMSTPSTGTRRVIPEAPFWRSPRIPGVTRPPPCHRRRVGQLFRSVSGALGLRRFLERAGHTLVTPEKDGRVRSSSEPLTWTSTTRPASQSRRCGSNNASLRYHVVTIKAPRVAHPRIYPSDDGVTSNQVTLPLDRGSHPHRSAKWSTIRSPLPRPSPSPRS